MTTADRILRALQASGQLDDDELAQRLGVRRQQVNQTARRMEQRGQIRRFTGPRGKLVNSLKAQVPPLAAPSPRRSPSVGAAPRGDLRFADNGTEVTGTAVTAAELGRLGFRRHELDFLPTSPALAYGTGVDWNTLGDIPTGPGLYAFVGAIAEGDLRVMYVGLTTHLWMVTKGALPGGSARGGQRYGRPRHAGQTRQRVNCEVARLRARGIDVTHWLMPVQPPAGVDVPTYLRLREEQLIRQWRLRTQGWNRR
jgi:biotin operon repressor